MMDVETLIAVILAVVSGFSGIYVRLNALEAKLIAHIAGNSKPPEA